MSRDQAFLVHNTSSVEIVHLMRTTLKTMATFEFHSVSLALSLANGVSQNVNSTAFPRNSTNRITLYSSSPSHRHVHPIDVMKIQNNATTGPQKRGGTPRSRERTSNKQAGVAQASSASTSPSKSETSQLKSHGRSRRLFLRSAWYQPNVATADSTCQKAPKLDEDWRCYPNTTQFT